MSMQDKVIAITGGASGIGLAAAKTIASRGGTVCIADIDQSALDAVSAELEAQKAIFMATRVDVTQSSSVNSWILDIIQRFSRLHGAANCAGIIGPNHGIACIADTDDGEWDRIIAVNLTGCMYSMRAELRHIIDGGSIVNVSSIQGVMGFANFAAYSASKHGVVGLTRSAAKEAGARGGTRVNAVAPGVIATPLLVLADSIQGTTEHKEPTAIGRLGTPEEVGAVITFLLGDESRFVTGAVWGVDGGWAC